MSEDCRAQFPDAIVQALAGHEDFYEGCIVEPFPASLNATNGWQWPGAYPYAAADSAFTSFLGCLKTLFIGVGLSSFFAHSFGFYFLTFFSLRIANRKPWTLSDATCRFEGLYSRDESNFIHSCDTHVNSMQNTRLLSKT